MDTATVERLARGAGFDPIAFEQPEGYDGGETKARFERFAAAVRAEALEEAARVCDSVEDSEWHSFKRGAGRGDPQCQGQSDGASQCAAAIRALKP